MRYLNFIYLSLTFCVFVQLAPVVKRSLTPNLKRLVNNSAKASLVKNFSSCSHPEGNDPNWKRYALAAALAFAMKEKENFASCTGSEENNQSSEIANLNDSIDREALPASFHLNHLIAAFVFGWIFKAMNTEERPIQYVEIDKKCPETDPILLDYLFHQIDTKNVKEFERIIMRSANWNPSWYFNRIIEKLNTQTDSTMIHEFIVALFKHSKCDKRLARSALLIPNLKPDLSGILDSLSKLVLLTYECENLTVDLVSEMS